MNREDYYACQRKVPRWQEHAQDLLSRTKCLVVGLGGLGCPVSMYLAGSGAEHLGICDYDRIEASNISRQVLYTPKDIGTEKTEVAAKRLREQNPFLKLVVHNEKMNEAVWQDILSDYDLIFDCTDNFHSKYLIHDACLLLKKDLIQAGIFQMSGQVYFFPFSRRTDDQGSGKAKNKMENSACLRCVWEEAPSHSQNCAEGGVLTAVAGTTALRQVNTALLSLLHKNKKAAAHMSLFDWESLEWDLIAVPPSKSCACRSPETLKDLTAYLHEASLEIKGLSALESLENPMLVDVRDPVDQREQKKFQPYLDKGMKLQNVAGDDLSTLQRFMQDNGRESSYILVCYQGRRSLSLAKILREHGYSAFSYAGGYNAI